MSLRDALHAAVACCTPLPMQHATFKGNDATGDATAVQPKPANPHGIRVSGATGNATPLQQAQKADATRGDSDEKLHVAFASTCNTQPGALTAHRLMREVIAAAMRCCDRHGDGHAAREQMRQDVLATPAHLRADLLDYFQQTYGATKHD